METVTNDKSQAAAEMLNHLAKLEPVQAVEPVEKLHGATFPVGGHAAPTVSGSPDSADDNQQAEGKIAELLEEIGHGFQQDDATNFEKLMIARRYGPLLWELKTLAPHGTFKQRLRERFPKVNYSKCNRWMFLARHEEEIEAAIAKYPDVAWGPKKMIDFLKGVSVPDEEGEEDEEVCCGYIGEELGVSEAPVPDTSESGDDAPTSMPDEGTAIVTTAGYFGPTTVPVTPAVGKRSRRGKPNSGTSPTIKRTEYEVEVRLGFKLSVPDNVTAEEIAEALKGNEGLTVAIKTPFDYEMSEKGVLVSHVRPWDNLDQFQPESVPAGRLALND